MVAALYVQRNGVYWDLPGVDPWDEARDARKYAGPWPVVAHPPCARWCKPLAWVNQTRYGHKVGEDGGCFESALSSVRRWGGILEHPAESFAWERFCLPRPPRRHWERSICGGWVCEVQQGAYGHPARKRTWLYAHGVQLPDMDWSRPAPTAQVSWLKGTARDLPRITGKQASATPIPFRDLLLSIARSARQERAA